ncbi:MAG: Ion trans protein [Thermoleophilia bacterium]|nr:Ion trans protein [Thermoleophilia bacterium]
MPRGKDAGSVQVEIDMDATGDEASWHPARHRDLGPFILDRALGYPYELRAHSSAGERSLHTREVPGSIPGAPIDRRTGGAQRELRAVSAEAAGREDLKGTTYELFILAISILSIVNLVLEVVIPDQTQSWWLIVYIDVALTFIFLADFTYRLLTAPTKRWYLRHGGGVFDFLGCLPGLRIFRLFRILRAVRIIRRLGGPRVLQELRESFASGTLYLVVLLLLLVLEFVGLLELHFEHDAVGANITTGGDALWWGYVTATTVGYGDQYPVTMAGRIVGAIMLTVGVALFATFSGFLANTFLSSKQPKSAEPSSSGDLQAALAELEHLAAEQQRATSALRVRIAELDGRS